MNPHAALMFHASSGSHRVPSFPSFPSVQIRPQRVPVFRQDQLGITEHYANCFSLPPVGRRNFLRASSMVSGFESLPCQFRAQVPPA
jgi:hypothetical protein